MLIKLADGGAVGLVVAPMPVPDVDFGIDTDAGVEDPRGATGRDDKFFDPAALKLLCPSISVLFVFPVSLPPLLLKDESLESLRSDCTEVPSSFEWTARTVVAFLGGEDKLEDLDTAFPVSFKADLRVAELPAFPPFRAVSSLPLSFSQSPKSTI
jgi:hypothetical protein